MANPHPDSPWTDERVQELLRLWGRRWSAAEIAKELAHPRITRSAVLGRLKRMGLTIGKPRPPTLSKHVEAEWSRKRRVREKEAKMSPKSVAVIPAFLPKRAPEPGDPATVTSVTFWRLIDTTCRWPLFAGHEPISEKLYCGAVSLDGGPYCREHSARAFQKSMHR